MKKYLIKILLFFAIIICLDISFGFVCRYLETNGKGGKTQKLYYTAHNCEADILVFGSSKALRHYDPTILEDSLSMTAYNCGLGGNGIIYHFGLLQTMLKRYTPKLVILDAVVEYDTQEEDNTKYLHFLRRLYGIPEVDSIFYNISPNDRYKMMSQFYRYNEEFVKYVKDFGRSKVSIQGFEPLTHTIDYMYEPKDIVMKEWNPTKKYYFGRFLKECKNRKIQVVVAYTPKLKEKSDTAYTYITEYCRELNVPLINYAGNPEFAQDSTLYSDFVHMNKKGDKKFTSSICPKIKSILGSCY